MSIKTDTYLQIGLPKEIFKKFKELQKMEDWQQKYTLVIVEGGYSNEVSRLLDMLENEIEPLFEGGYNSALGDLLDNIDILYEYTQYPSNRNLLDWIEVYGY